MVAATAIKLKPRKVVTFGAESTSCGDCEDQTAHVGRTREVAKPTIKDPERYKTVPCKNWKEKGRCPYGPRCQFAHGAHELRTRAGSAKAESKTAAPEPWLPTPSPSPTGQTNNAVAGQGSSCDSGRDSSPFSISSSFDPPVPLPTHMVEDLVGQGMPRRLSSLWDADGVPEMQPQVSRTSSLSQNLFFDPHTGSVVCSRQASHSTTMLADSLMFLFND